MSAAPATPLAFTHWRVWGTTVSLGVHPARALPWAKAAVVDVLEEFDRSCNRFSSDSELTRLNNSGGQPVAVSGRLAQALDVALDAAQRTDGAVDPTVGNSLEALGYDRDFDALADVEPTLGLPGRPARAAGWRSVRRDTAAMTVTLPPRVHLDLGATAKALCADEAALRVARTLDVGVLVDIGGDIATAGPPPVGGWRVAVVENARTGVLTDGCVVAITGGGLASSGTTARTWERGGARRHHIVDPESGWPAEPVWSMVTVAAGTCVDANTAATAAVVWGNRAPSMLSRLGLSARFVGRDRTVTSVGGWPEDNARLRADHQSRGA